MIEIESPAASQRRPFSPLAARQRRRALLDDGPRSPFKHRQPQPDPSSDKKRALRPPNPTKARSIFLSSARRRQPAIPKSP
jgi:hypothetical protein